MMKLMMMMMMMIAFEVVGAHLRWLRYEVDPRDVDSRNLMIDWLNPLQFNRYMYYFSLRVRLFLGLKILSLLLIACVIYQFAETSSSAISIARLYVQRF